MALTLQIKRSTGTVAPSTLQDGELAYTHGNEKLYIGDGSTVKLIGGKAYNDLIDHAAGTLTAGSALLVDGNKAIDDFIVGNNSTTGGSVKFKEGTANGTDHVSLKAPNSLAASVTFTLPSADGTSNQVLATNGSGELSFTDAVTSEAVEDIVGTQLVTNGTHTLISAAYDDAGDGAIDLTVDNNLANYDNTHSGFITSAAIPTNNNQLTNGAGYITATSTDTLTNKSGNVSMFTNDAGYLTAETNDLSAAVTWANVPDANITESSVTQHQAALSITESQVSDLGAYIEDITAESVGDLSDVTITAAASGEFLRYNGTAWVDSTIQNGDISSAMVTQHEASLTITESQISDLQSYLTSVSQSDVTQHQAALSIATTQLTGTVTNAQLAGSITNAKLVNSSVVLGSDTVNLGDTITDLNGLTSADVDNLTLDGNTVSTTDTNGDLVLSPNGTGTVTVPSGYEGRAGFGSDSLVNKSYVDSVANGLDVKESVRVATTGDLSATYANGAGTLTANANGAIVIDGVTLVLNDRVLVKDQTTQTENGIYKVTTVGSGSAAFVLTRTPDANDAAELTGGVFTFVEEGTANADNGYVATHNGTPTFGTTNITFDQFSGAGQIAAGNGLTKTGNTIDAVGTSNRISVSANAIDIAATYVGQSSITTLGTIATGTWNGSTIDVAYGGTGITSAAKGSVLVANTADTFSALDGGGVDDGFLSYNASTDTISWATSIDGGTF